MKKIILPSLLIAALAGLAAAQGPKKAAAPQVKMTCAVMSSNSVDIAKATKAHMYADYKGRRYFFCCEGCPAAFKANPAKYAKSKSIPTPKSTKPAK